MGTGEGAPFTAEASLSRFPLVSTRRELTDNTERSGSWLGNESSCCVNRKQQQEPWAQFTHTWHRARLQGVKLREGADATATASRGCAADARGTPLCDQPEAGPRRRGGGVTGCKGGSPVFYMNRGKKNQTSKQTLPPA